MSVVRSGTLGAVTSVFPRGGESDYTLVLIDDVPANAFGGGFDFSHLSVNDVERIEVVRGPQSALFGSNAIGAVVRVITRDGGPLRGDATVEGGSFDTARLAASTSGHSENWFWGAGVERLTTNNANGQRTSAGEIVENDDYNRTETGASGGWRRPDGAALRGEVRFEKDDRGFPGPYGSNPVGAFTRDRHRVSRESTIAGSPRLAARSRPGGGFAPMPTGRGTPSTAISPARSARRPPARAVGQSGSSRMRTFATASISLPAPSSCANGRRARSSPTTRFPRSRSNGASPDTSESSAGRRANGCS